MCFSATASFVAGTALSATGAVTLAETKKKSDIPFASIPLLFGIQQFVEGAVWLSFQNSAQIFNHIATYAYLGLAYVLWPIFVPFCGVIGDRFSPQKNIVRISVCRTCGRFVSFVFYFEQSSRFSNSKQKYCLFYAIAIRCPFSRNVFARDLCEPSFF